MGLLDGLGIAASGLFAQQRGIQITSHNITNAGTPGFTRQEVVIEANSAPAYGVNARDVHRAIDNILGGRIVGQEGRAGFADAHARGLANVESLVGGLGEQGLSASLDRLFQSFRALTASPGEAAIREDVLARAEALASQVRTHAAALTNAQQEIDREVVSHVAEVNTLIDQVAQLNHAVIVSESGGGNTADLRDQRDIAVRRLGELAGAQSLEDPQGRVTVLIAGVGVVQGDEVRHLTTRADPTTGLQSISVGTQVVLADPSSVPPVNRMTSGALGGLLVVRDRDIPSQKSQLDAFAFDLATAVNGVHRNNFGLDGVSGRNFFATPTGVSGAAAQLTLDASLAGFPARLAAATDPLATPGDARGAQALVDLESASVAGGGQSTLSGAISNMLAALGRTSSGAQASAMTEADHLAQLKELRESQSGVSIDEQMLNLNRYQRAFQAASRVVSTIDGLMDSLLRM